MPQKLQKPTVQWFDGFVIALLYFLLAFFTKKLPILTWGSPLWPSAGIALGGLLIRGRSLWWGIFLGATLFNWFGISVQLPVALISGLIPSVGAYIAASLVLRLNQTGNFLGNVRHAWTFIIVNTCTGTLLQSLLGVGTVALNGIIPWDRYGIEALNWWVGDTIGILVFAPLVVAWWDNNSPKIQLSFSQLLELFLVTVTLLSTIYFSFVESQPLENLILPPLLWSAFRLGNKVTTALVVVTGITAAAFTLNQKGIFFRIVQEFNSVIFLQLFIGVVSITTIITLSLVAENRRAILNQQQALQQLDEINHNLERIVEERTQELVLANNEISQLNQKLASDNLRMSSELAVTRKLQEMILPKPKELKAIAELEIAGFMQPADEVGGDYYDILADNGTIKIGIGDVTGHGLESGVIMIMVQTAIRALLASGETNPIKLLKAVNSAIYGNLQRMNCDKSLTLTILNYANNTLNIAGQHESVIVLRSDGTVENIDTMDLGFPIGLMKHIDEFCFDLSIQLNGGDTVVLYTDGIPEAENPAKELYGMERFIAVLQKYRHLSAETMRQCAIEDVLAFVGSAKIYDDITLVILKPKVEVPMGDRPESVLCG